MRVVDIIRTSEGGRWTIPVMVEAARRGHEAVLMMPEIDQRLGCEAREAGVTVQRCSARLEGAPSLTPWNLGKLRRQIDGIDPDVVLYQLIQTALVVRAATLGAGYARVHQVPGPLYLDHPGIRAVERQLARLDDYVICGDRSTASRYVGLGVSPERVSAIPFGIDVDRFSEDFGDRAYLRQQWGVPVDNFVVVMYAYFYPPRGSLTSGLGVKGHEVLAAAWQRFAARHDDVSLVLVGDGWGEAGDQYRATLINQFLHECPPGSLTFINGQNDGRPFYALADLSVSPSMSESLGAPIEAGAAGVPSIVSDAGGLPETVTDYSGWVFPRGDDAALDARLEQAHAAFREGRLEQMGKVAQTHMRDMVDARKTAAAVVDVLEKAARTHAS